MKRAYPLIFLIVLTGSIFITSDAFVNVENTPKYYFFMIVMLGGAVILPFFARKLRLPQFSLFAQILLLVFAALVIVQQPKVHFIGLLPLLCIVLLGLLCLQITQVDFIPKLLNALFITGIVLALRGCLQYAGWAPSPHGQFAVTGPFDNPAGFAATLALLFPAGLFLLLRGWGKNVQTWLYGAGVSIIGAAVLLSGSRSGMLSILASSGLLIVVQTSLIAFMNKIPHWKTSITIMVLFTLVAAGAGLYTLNPDSADGRLLIWRVSADMIADKPVVGHGGGGFQAHYMDYQAGYFAKHPNSRFRQLADSVKHPFNEFVLAAVEYGIAGLLIILLVAFFLIKHIVHATSEWKFLCLSGLFGFFIFAFFSYPLQYIPVWILVIFYGALPIKTRQREFQHRPIALAAKTAVIVVGLAGLLVSFRQIRAELQWNDVAQRSLAGETRAMLPEYQKLYPRLKHHPFFLYNYGAELNVAEKYEESIRILNECKNQFNDYDLQLLLAKNHRQKGQLQKAAAMYRYAAQMIPVRFWPLYQLVEIYRERGHTRKAIAMAKQIMDKKVKVPSSTVSSIKYEMETFLADIEAE